MALAEIRQQYNEPVLSIPEHQEWILSPDENSNDLNIHPRNVEFSLHLVSDGCSKQERKRCFKEAYENIMSSYPNATYQERLDIAKKTVASLQEQNPDINPNIFKSLRRSFAARTGNEITKLRREIKKADITQILPSGKENHYQHHWSYAINHIMEPHKGDKDTEKSVLIKIIDTRNQLKSIINTQLVNKVVKATPEEILKMSESHIAQLIARQKYTDVKTVLERRNIEQLLNMTDTKSSIYMSQAAFYNRNYHTLESWIDSVIERQ